MYSDIQILIDQGVDIVCVKSTQNRYFVGSRLFELPELKLLVDAVESSHFITRKKSASLIRKLVSLTSQEQASSTALSTWRAQQSRTTRRSTMRWT